MQKHSLFVALVSIGMTLGGCGLPKSSDDGSSGNNDDGTTTADDTSGGTFGPGGDDTGTDPSGAEDESDGGNAETTATTGTDPDSGGTAADGSTGADDGGVVNECDIWAQDCPEGEKCMPYESVPESSWDALKCVPIVENPDQLGDVCTVVDHGASGFDSCDKGLICWDVDPETLEGECIGFCQGSPDNYSCEDPTGFCIPDANEGVLPICLPGCDPLLQDCAEGKGCYPVGETFVCAPDASGDVGGHGTPCEYINVCDPGYWCGGAAGIPGCEGSPYCCTAFCDISQDPATQCVEGAAGGQQCMAWFEEGTAPPDYQNVGGCYLPG